MVSLISILISTLCLYDAVDDFDDSDATSSLLLFRFDSQSPITQRCATIGVIDDDIAESTETFTITASGATFVGGQDTVLIIIRDNDSKSITQGKQWINL